MAYNTTFMNNATNILDLSIGIGESMGNAFLIGNLLLFSFFMIFMVLGLRGDKLEMLIINSFLTTLIGSLLFMVGMVGSITLVACIVILILSITFKFIIKQ